MKIVLSCLIFLVPFQGWADGIPDLQQSLGLLEKSLLMYDEAAQDGQTTSRQGEKLAQQSAEMLGDYMNSLFAKYIRVSDLADVQMRQLLTEYAAVAARLPVSTQHDQFRILQKRLPRVTVRFADPLHESTDALISSLTPRLYGLTAFFAAITGLLLIEPQASPFFYGHFVGISVAAGGVFLSPELIYTPVRAIIASLKRQELVAHDPEQARGYYAIQAWLENFGKFTRWQDCADELNPSSAPTFTPFKY